MKKDNLIVLSLEIHHESKTIEIHTRCFPKNYFIDMAFSNASWNP